MSFQLVPKSVTLNDLERRNGRYFALFHRTRVRCRRKTKSKVSGILRELLKQKLIALHASSAVRVCQLLCTAPLETFQMQVLTNNLGHRRTMNTRLQ